MSQPRKRSPSTYVLLVWMIFNAIFYLAEVTILEDTADLNNSIMLILLVISIAGLVLMKKWGAGLTAFTLSYAFAFNVFNVVYYKIYLLNGTSAIINAAAIVLIFKAIFDNKFH